MENRTDGHAMYCGKKENEPEIDPKNWKKNKLGGSESKMK